MKIAIALLVFTGCEKTASRSIDAAPVEVVAIDAAAVATTPVPPPPPPPRPVGPLRVVSQGMIVLGKAVRGRGPARLENCEVPANDYDSYADHGLFAASRSVDPTRVRPEDRDWLQRPVRLGGDGVSCIGAVTELRVLGQLRGLGDSWSDDPEQLADAILSQGHPVLVGAVDAPCAQQASWAVPAASLAPIRSTIPLEIEQEGDCAASRTFRITYRGNTLAEGGPPFALLDEIDIDHDGWPELILADGWLAPDAAHRHYRREKALTFPHDWYDDCIE